MPKSRCLVALFEDSLYALAHLLHRVEAKEWEEHIRSDIVAWQENHDAAQHLGKYGGHSTYDDWVIHPQNRHRVDEIQAVWADALLFKLQKVILRELAEKPNDLRQERKIINGLNRHCSILKEPSPNRPQSKLKKHGSGKYLREICCQRCGDRHATHWDVENVIAADVISDCLIDSYESGTMIELVDTLLDGKLKDLADMRTRVGLAAENAGIAVIEKGRQRDLCAACGSDDVSVQDWALWRNGQLRFKAVEYLRERDNKTSDVAADTVRQKSDASTLRIWGITIAIFAFFVLIVAFRYLHSRGTPAATGSLRGNWSTLILLGLPLVGIVGGALQGISGINIRDYSSVFSGHRLSKKIIIATGVIAIAITAIVLATLIG